MKQIKKLLSVLLVLAMVIAHVPSVAVSAEGETAEYTLTFDVTTKRTEFSTSKQVWTENGITFTNNKGSGSNIADYAKPVRLYKNSDITVECDGKPITKIVFNANSTSYATALKNAITANTNYTVSVSSKAVTVIFTKAVTSFAVKLTADQVRMDSLVVTVQVGGGDEGGSEPEEPTQFDVSFDLNGAEGDAPDTIQVAEGAAYGTLPAPTREGYTFVGWFTEAACTNAVNAETIVTQSHTLYAKWSKNLATHVDPATVTYTYGSTGSYSNIIKNWGIRGDVATSLSPNATAFYTGDNTYAKLSAKTGSATLSTVPQSDLYLALKALMVSKHTKSTTYDEVNNLLAFTDCQNGDDSTISLFYCGENVSSVWDGGTTFNKEHCWPKSLTEGSSDTDNVDADIMTLRAAKPGNNSARGNKPYGAETTTNTFFPNHYTTEYDLRGDCARILLYTYVRWGEELDAIDSVALLLSWIQADPVDSWELARNDSVQSITGTRNVFVDYPQLAFILFGEEVPSDLTVPNDGAEADPTPGGDTEITEVTIDFTTTTDRVSWNSDQQTWANGGLTLVNTKTSGSSSVVDASNPARFYKGSIVTITCDNMTQITFVGAGESKYKTAIGDSLTDAGYTPKVDGNSYTITFVVPLDSLTITMSAQARMSSMTVTVAADDGSEGDDPVIHTVSFDLGGAEGTAPATRQVVEGAAYGTLPEVSREGYNFLGWFTEAACTNAVNAETIVTQSHTLYAKWEPKPVATVSFDLGGAEGDAPEAVTVIIGEAYGTLPLVSREGFLFGGWFTEGGTAVKVTDIVEATHTLYAHWIEGETIQTAINFSTTDQRTVFSEEQQVWENEGLTFTNDKANSSSAMGDYSSGSNTHVRLYKDSVVTIACEGMLQIQVVSEGGSEYKNAFAGSLATAGLYYILNGNTFTIFLAEPTDTLTIPMAGGQARLKSITVSTLAPETVKFDVSFDLGGAEGDAPDTIQVAEGTAYGTLPEVSREGYNFLGWFTEAACTNAVNADTIVTGSHTLYAKWELKPVFTVSFDLGGAEGTAPETIQVEEGAAYGTLPAVAREGYLFGGWFTEGGTAVKVTDIVEATHTLYAHWIEGETIQTAINFSTTDQRTGFSEEQQVWKNEGLTFTNNKAGSSNAMGDYSSGSNTHVRLYKYSEVIIACEGMLQIQVVSEGASEYKNAFAASLNEAELYYILNGNTFTIFLAEPTDTLTIPMNGGQARLKSITVSTLAPVAEDTIPDYFTYSIDGTNLTITGYSGTEADLVIDSTYLIGGVEYTVTAIGAFAFEGCSSLTEITIPDSVTSIGGSAFEGCSALEIVYYGGTLAQKNAIEILSNNDCLLNAAWYCNFNSTDEGTSDIVNGWGLTLNDEIVANFKMTFTPEILADEQAYVEVKVGDKVTEVPVSEVNGPLQVAVYATQMNDKITLCVVDGNSGRSEENTFTIRQYCETILASQQYEEYHQLVKEMLNYGGAAQAYFGHNTDELASEGIIGAGQVAVPESSSATGIRDQIEDLKCIGATLVYRDKIALRYYFEGSLEGYTFSAIGAATTPIVNVEGGYVEIADILPQNLDVAVTLEVEDAQGNLLQVDYCPMNYITRMNQKGSENTKALVKALYNYYLAAKAFVNK